MRACTASRTLATLALGALLAAGPVSCGDLVGPPFDPDAPIRTDRARYVLEEVDGRLETEIGWTFTNPTGADVLLSNCNGHTPVTLEKWVGDTWVTAWAVPIPECLSPPIVIEPDGSHTATIHAETARPGTGDPSAFQVQVLDGSYRLVLEGASRDGDPPAKLPKEDRVSRPFRLVVDD